MNERRGRDTSASTFGQAAYNRVLQKVEEGNAAVTARMEALFDRMNERLDRVDRDLATKEQADAGVQIELRELKRDLGELRDAAAIVPARAAVTVPPVVWRTAWGKVVSLAVGLTAVLVLLNNLPDAARGWDRFWVFLRGDDQRAVHAKQDTTDGR